MADDILQPGGTDAAGSTPSTPDPISQSATTALQTPTSVPQDPIEGSPHPDAVPAASPAAPAAPATPSQAQQFQSARDYARAMGFDPGQAGDDASFLQNLFQQARQSQQAQQQALAYQRALMMQQQRAMAPAAAAVAAPEKPKAWNPPEWNSSWESLITRDEKGNPALLPGAPPEILGKYLQHQQYKRDFADRFLANPSEALKPFVTEMAQEQAQQIAEKQLRSYQDKVHVDNFLSQNSSWLHQRDQAGQLVRDPLSGQPVLSAAGTRFQQYVVQAERSGMSDIRSQEQYAKGMLQRDLLHEQFRMMQAQQGQQQQNQQLVQQGNRQPNSSGTLPRPGVPAQQPAQNASLSLRDQLTQAIKSAGITDEQIAL